MTRGGGSEEAVRRPEDRPEEPSGPVEGGEQAEVGEGEELAEDEVGHVAECFGPHSIRRHGRAEEEGQVDAGQGQLAARPQGQHQRAGEAAGHGTPGVHRPSRAAKASAARMRARWVRAWGKFPRKAPVVG